MPPVTMAIELVKVPSRKASVDGGFELAGIELIFEGMMVDEKLSVCTIMLLLIRPGVVPVATVCPGADVDEEEFTSDVCINCPVRRAEEVLVTADVIGIT